MNAHATDAGPELAAERGPDQTRLDSDPGASPGRRLRRARETRRIEVGRIATELRLSPQTIAALERDDYEHLPSPVFIAGYIRSYARLLGQDPEPLVDAFRRLHPDAEPPPRMVGRSDADDIGGGWLVPLIGVLAVAALIGGGYLWWTNRPPLPEPTLSGDATEPASTFRSPRDADRGTPATALSDPSPVQEPLDPSPLDPSMDALGPEAGAITALEPPAPLPVPEAPERIGTDTDTMAGLDPAGLDRLPVEDAFVDADDELAGAGETALADIVDPSATAAESAASDAPPGDATGGSEVVVAFTGPCWVDIRDATGDFKLFGEMGDGDRHVLGGEPPYSLIIGNASAVQMQIGGAPFDVAAIARGNVARFTLDAATIAEVAGNRSDAADASSPD